MISMIENLVHINTYIHTYIHTTANTFVFDLNFLIGQYIYSFVCTGNEMHLYDISYQCTTKVHSTDKYFCFYVSYRFFCPSYRCDRYEGPLISVRH